MKSYITYPILFWLFFFGSILGVLIEGICCLIRYKRWETHTVTIWGPFCIIYGLGALVLYLGAVIFEKVHMIGQFFLFSIITTLIEYICGIILKYGLHMKAWDYSNHLLNFQGIICFKMTIIWGLFGVAFAYLCVPRLKLWSLVLQSGLWKIVSYIMSVLMAFNLLATFACIIRWAMRHRGIAPKNQLARFIDKNYGDDKMSRRFCEWRFLDDKSITME